MGRRSPPHMPLYAYAGLTLSSTDPLPGLEALNDEAGDVIPDFVFCPLETPPPEPAAADWVHHWRTAADDLTLSLARTGQGFFLRFPSLADFVVSADGRQIEGWRAPDANEATLHHLLLDQALPRCLSHQGRVVLHASAVSMDGRAVAFAAETGLGKSTLAASLHRSGSPLLTDDGLVVASGASDTSGTSALPLCSGLRLYPASAATLFPESPPGETMAHYSDKARVDVVRDGAVERLELAAVFILAPPPAERGGCPVEVEPLSQRDACIEIIRHSFQLDVSDTDRAARLLDEAAEVARNVPVFSLTYPRDFSCLPAVHASILEKVQGGTAPPQASSDIGGTPGTRDEA
ncbi:hypothetical protein ACFL3S_08595 [Gemmatimonadota bacterium]